MSGNGAATTTSYPADIFADDAPDMSDPYWIGQIASAKVQRGRPKSAEPKVSTTIRLSPAVLAYFKADGPGWQTRIDAALRKAAGLDP